MAEARPVLPTDLLALVSYNGRNYPNQAWTRERLGSAEPPNMTLGSAVDQFLAFARGRSTWISVRRRRLRGLVGARTRGDRQAWEIDYLIDATTQVEALPGLLECAVMDVGRSGGFTVDGAPARLVPAEEDGRLVLIPGRAAFDVEFPARDVPAFGFRRVRLARVDGADAEAERRVAPGRRKARIAAGGVIVSVREDGCFDVDFGGARFEGLGAFDVSNDGTLIYSISGIMLGQNQIVAVERTGRVRPLLEEASTWAQPRISPDGRRLLVRRAGQPDCHLWLYDLERRALTRLTFEGDNHGPMWTNGGNTFTFSRATSAAHRETWRAHVSPDMPGRFRTMAP